MTDEQAAKADARAVLGTNVVVTYAFTDGPNAGFTCSYTRSDARTWSWDVEVRNSHGYAERWAHVAIEPSIRVALGDIEKLRAMSWSG